MVKYTGRGLVVKRPGVLSKIQILTLVLGVGVFSVLPIRRVLGRGGGHRSQMFDAYGSFRRSLSRLQITPN